MARGELDQAIKAYEWALARERGWFFLPEDADRLFLLQLRAAEFSVFLNGRKILARVLPGHRVPFLEGTEYAALSPPTPTYVLRD